jgi:hypothetical protein
MRIPRPIDTDDDAPEPVPSTANDENTARRAACDLTGDTAENQTGHDPGRS